MEQWFIKLPHHVKAEILGSVLHELEHMPEIWKQLPVDYKARIHYALYSCGIDISDLSKDDIALMFQFFNAVKNAPLPEIAK